MIFTTEYLNRILNAKSNLKSAIKQLGGDIESSTFSDYPNIISNLDFNGKVAIKLSSVNNGYIVKENDTSFTPEDGFAFNYANIAIPFTLKNDLKITENGTYKAVSYKTEGIFSFEVNVDTDADDVFYVTKTITKNGTYRASDEVKDGTNLEDEESKKTLVPAFNNVKIQLPMITDAKITENGTFDASDWSTEKEGNSDFQGFATGKVDLLYIDKSVELNEGEEMDLYVELEEKIKDVKPSGYKSITVTINPGEIKTEYTANFYNGTILLASKTVPAGVYVTYTGATPTKKGYTFSGWDPALNEIDRDTSYFAVFTPTSAGRTTVDELSVSWEMLSDPNYIEDPDNPITPGITKKHLNIGCINNPETIGTQKSLLMRGNGETAYCIGKDQDDSKYIWAFSLPIQYASTPGGNAGDADLTFFNPTLYGGIPCTEDENAFEKIVLSNGTITAKYISAFAEQGMNDSDINITYENSYISTFLNKLADAIEEQNPGIKINTVEKKYAKLKSNGQYEEENNYIRARCWLFSYKEMGLNLPAINAYEESRNYTFPTQIAKGYQQYLRADSQKFIPVLKWNSETNKYENVIIDGVAKTVSRGSFNYMDVPNYTAIESKTAYLRRNIAVGFCIG